MIMNTISMIANICTIAGLIVTIIQIIKVKSRVEKTEDIVCKLLSMEKHLKLEEILTIVKNQHSVLNKLKVRINDKGFLKESFNDTVSMIIDELSRAADDMPMRETSIAKSIRSAIIVLNSMEKDCLTEAEGYLYTSIQGLKKKIEAYKEIEMNYLLRNSN